MEKQERSATVTRVVGSARTPTQKVLLGVGLFVAVCLLAILGYMVAGWKLGDAAYMVVITIFGVGYGEVQPVDTWPLRLLTTVVIVGGYGAVFFALGGVLQMIIDGEITSALGARRMSKDIDRLSGHAIICGYGRMGVALAAELAEAGKPFVAIETDEAILRHSEDIGQLAVNGDATDERVLEEAGIQRASVLATVLSDDSANVFVTLTARSMNPELTIVARGENASTEAKLLSCGADTVVLPTAIGAAKMGRLITRPSAELLLDRITTSVDTTLDMDEVGLELDEIIIEKDSRVAGSMLGDIEVRGAHGYLVVGIRRRDGSTLLRPASDVALEPGDTVIVLGYRSDIPRLVGRFASSPTKVSYRGVSSAQ
ncbi:MAG: potassium channel family protein [Microthrixaceae bacterium]